MIRTIVFGCLIAIALAVDKDTCDHKGKTYKKGEGFMDDCNYCFCGGNDVVGCTKMLCRPRPSGQYSNLEAGQDTCEHKGKMYKKGDRFMDDCNHCFCGGNNMVGCTKMMCRPHPEYSNMEVGQDTCEHKGKMYKKGDSFMDDCNRCFCGGNNMVGCTRMMCRPHHAPEYSNMEVGQDTCEHKGKMYKKGDSFMDDCNSCFCGGNNIVGCTKMMCRPIHAPEYSNMEVGQDTCEHKGKMYKKGDAFMDDCNHCFCGGNNMVGCTKMMCRPHPEYSNMEADQDTCEHKGKIYKKGDRFMDDCNNCVCGENNVVRCTKMWCRPHHANPYENLEDEQKTCTHNGKSYNIGDHFMNDCNKCFCGVNGNIGCTQMLCIHPEKNQYSDSETCTRDGKVYKKGDHFSLDGCNMCFCGGNDMIGCTKKLCLKGCFHEGKLYKVGESFKKDCNRCICTKNGGICTAMACLPQNH